MTTEFNILMYSHDTYGLGHIRRTLIIAQSLIKPGVNILIITGSPLAGLFDFPEGVDYVRIPGMIKNENGIYQPSAIRLDPDQVMNIRKELILSTIMAFKPDLFIVDKEPLGLKKEVLPGLRWIKSNLPNCQTVLGLRDIMDEAGIVQANWKKKKVFSALESLYSEIWVYGSPELYNPIIEYQIPETIVPKVVFTGYIQRPLATAEDVEVIRKQFSPEGQDLILVTTGGGKDGYTLLNTFLTWCENKGANNLNFACLVVFGPFLPKHDQDALKKRLDSLNIHTMAFHDSMDRLIGACDLMICMGGYNTLCEALSNQTPALVIPREHPRKEQLLRAQVMAEKKLLEYIPTKQMTPENLGKKITEMLEHKNRYQQAITKFEMNGIDAIERRVAELQKSLKRQGINA